MIKKILIFFVVLIGIVVMGSYVFMQSKPFGKLPEGGRLARVQQSPNYRDGEFKNLHSTELATGKKSRWRVFYEFVFDDIKGLRPKQPLPFIKTDLTQLPQDRNWFVWFGHSSYLINLDGKKILVDPVLVAGSPISFINKMFAGSNAYQPADMPEIDYLIITHDHWDHLDYEAVTQLLPKVKQVITSLGVGSHLEYWGYPVEKIHELDWQDEIIVDNLKITALPARHFSGRGLVNNQTLWSSFMVQGEKDNLYIGGDSGFDSFYQDIAKRFPNIRLAIMENGQYNKDWANIHIQPEQLVEAIQILKPQKVIAVHNSKFALSKHHWKDPLEKIAKNAEEKNLPLYTPMIGEVFYFSEEDQSFSKWWETLE